MAVLLECCQRSAPESDIVISPLVIFSLEQQHVFLIRVAGHVGLSGRSMSERASGSAMRRRERRLMDAHQMSVSQSLSRLSIRQQVACLSEAAASFCRTELKRTRTRHDTHTPSPLWKQTSVYTFMQSSKVSFVCEIHKPNYHKQSRQQQPPHKQTRKHEPGALMSHHPAWVGHHTGGSRSKPTVHPCPHRWEGCGLLTDSPTPQQ